MSLVASAPVPTFAPSFAPLNASPVVGVFASFRSSAYEAMGANGDRVRPAVMAVTPMHFAAVAILLFLDMLAVFSFC